MTKEEWLKISQQEELPLHVFYEYYLEKGGTFMNLLKFEEIFSSLIINGPIILGAGKPVVHITHVSAIGRLFRYYNEKFNIIKYEIPNYEQLQV